MNGAAGVQEEGWPATLPPQETHVSLETKETNKDGVDVPTLMGCLSWEIDVVYFICKTGVICCKGKEGWTGGGEWRFTQDGGGCWLAQLAGPVGILWPH